MNKTNTTIKFYNIPFNSQGIDKFFHLDKDGKHKQFKELLKTHTPVLIVGKDDTNDNKFTVENIRHNTRLSIKIIGKTTPIVNYAVIENDDKQLLDKTTTYWFVHTSGNIIDYNNYPLSLNLDAWATYGVEYFTQLDGKLVNYNKRHIDRWIKDTIKPFTIERKLTGLKNNAPIRSNSQPSSITSKGARIRINLPDNLGVLTKQEIKEYISEIYENSTVITDLDTYLADSNSYDEQIIRAESSKGVNALTVIESNISRVYITGYAVDPITTKEKMIERINNFLGLSENIKLYKYKNSINIIKKYGESAIVEKVTSAEGLSILEFHSKQNPFLFTTNNQVYHAFVSDTDNWNNAYYFDYEVKTSVFKKPIEIEVPSNDRIYGLTTLEWLNIMGFQYNLDLPTEVLSDLKTFHNNQKIKALGREFTTNIEGTPSDQYGTLSLEIKFTPSSGSIYVQNNDKTNELWTNSEFPQLLQADGGHRDYIPIEFPTDFITVGSNDFNSKVNKLPINIELGDNANIFYATACRIMRNKLTKITKNNFYIYAVVASAGLEEHKIGSSNSYTSPEFPYEYIPIVNPDYEDVNMDSFIDPNMTILDQGNLRTKLKSEKPSGTTGWFKNNNLSDLKEGLLESILRVIVSPIPLTKKIPSTSGSNNTEKMFNTYFKQLKRTISKTVGDKTITTYFFYTAINVNHSHLPEANSFDFSKIEELENELKLGNELPKYIDEDYLDRNIEVSLLNNNYESHQIKDLLSTTLIPLDSRRYYKYKRLIINPKFVKDGIDYDIKFEGANEIQFYEQSFNYSFGISAAEKILQNQANARQAQIDRIEKNKVSAQSGIGISAAGFGFGTAISTIAKTAAGAASGSILPYALLQGSQSIAQAAQVSVNTTLDDQQQRNVINSGIADSARSAPTVSENVISESRLESPFYNINKKEIGYNMKPFTLIVTKPNKEFKKQVANAMNRNGYLSHIHERFSLANLDTRWYWNFIQIANLREVTEEFNIPKNILFEMNEHLSNGIRIHWFRDGKISKDLSLANYEKTIYLDNLIKN